MVDFRYFQNTIQHAAIARVGDTPELLDKRESLAKYIQLYLRENAETKVLLHWVTEIDRLVREIQTDEANK